MCKLQAANHKTQSLQQPAKAAADQHHAHTQHSHTTQVISNILKACVELMAGSDCAMQAKAHMGALARLSSGTHATRSAQLKPQPNQRIEVPNESFSQLSGTPSATKNMMTEHATRGAMGAGSKINPSSTYKKRPCFSQIHRCSKRTKNAPTRENQ